MTSSSYDHFFEFLRWSLTRASTVSVDLNINITWGILPARNISYQSNQSVITQRMLNNTPFPLGVFYCKLRFYVPYRLNSPALLLTLQVQLSGKKRKTVDAKTQQRNLFHILLANIFFFQNVSSKITRNPPYLTCHTLSERWKLATFLGELLEKIRQALTSYRRACSQFIPLMC